MKELKIRAPKAKDARILAKLLVTEGEALMAIGKIPSEETDRRRSESIKLFLGLLNKSSDQIWALLADFAGMKPEELDECDLNTPALIIKGIAAHEEFRSFLDSLESIKATETT